MIEKIVELDSSNASKKYKNLQNMVCQFKGGSNLIFKSCQTTMFEDSDLKDVINDFKRKFEQLITEFRYQNSEIYNMMKSACLLNDTLKDHHSQKSQKSSNKIQRPNI